MDGTSWGLSFKRVFMKAVVKVKPSPLKTSVLAESFDCSSSSNASKTLFQNSTLRVALRAQVSSSWQN